jgi:hypothetical protein
VNLTETRTPEQVAIDDTRDALAKAEMDTADVNDLPDSDFAYIEPGGKKDDSGKTTPRSLRHFPIHDAAHVRNALARLSTSPFESKARPKVEAAARRLGIGEPAGKDDMEKTEKAAAAEPEEKKPAFPGAKPPFKGKKAKKVAKVRTPEDLEYRRVQKEAKRLRKMRKAQAVVAKAEKRLAKNDALDAGHAALEAVGEAMQEEQKEQAAGEDESKDLANLQTADEALHEFTTNESAEPGEMGKQYRALRKRANQFRKFRKAARDLDREQKRIAKIGARNNKSDSEQHDVIHGALLKLGFNKCSPMGKVAEAVTDTDAVEKAIAKAEPDPTEIMRKALEGIIPADKLEAIEAKLTAQGEQLAKIAKSPSGGGPATSYAPIFRAEEVSDKASALAKAAEVIDDPRLKEEVGGAAALALIQRQRGAS